MRLFLFRFKDHSHTQEKNDEDGSYDRQKCSQDRIRVRQNDVYGAAFTDLIDV